MLNMLGKSSEKNYIGLYRDDGLSGFRNYNGYENDKVRTDPIRSYKILSYI